MGVDEKTINDLINAETWLNGEECQQYFDFDIEESNEAVVSADSEYFDKYDNLPEELKKNTDDEKNNSSEIGLQEKLRKLYEDMNKNFDNISKRFDSINKKFDNINKNDDAVSDEEQKKKHDDRAAAILNDLDFI